MVQIWYIKARFKYWKLRKENGVMKRAKNFTESTRMIVAKVEDENLAEEEVTAKRCLDEVGLKSHQAHIEIIEINKIKHLGNPVIYR